MCGIAGFLSQSQGRGAQGLASVGHMANALAHRGPDNQGTWCDSHGQVFFGHRRLSIVDLTADGNQPMTSGDGRWTICFNGEIYNHRLLRKQLEAGGTRFRSNSDTEVLVEAVSRLGPVGAISAARGMFAIALWDSHERCLFLARDRLGEKPLYCGMVGTDFCFGSELRALFVHPQWNGEISHEALAQYFRYNCVPGDFSIFRGIRKVLPGQLLKLSASHQNAAPEVTRYWDFSAVVAQPRKGSAQSCSAAQLDELALLLKESVGEQMVADVPLGAFLSGGIDSSLVVALMQSQSQRPVKTFTIGFVESDFDESIYAKQVAQILGTDHTEHLVSGNDVLSAVPMLSSCFDEPFADSSQIPTLLVSQVARRHVTVSLSGDGGDELFGGYTRYPSVLRRWDNISRYPRRLRRLAAASADSCPLPILNLIGCAMRPLAGWNVPASGCGDRVRARARDWGVQTLPEAYRRAVSFWDRPSELVIGTEDRRIALDAPSWCLSVSDPKRWMMAHDSLTYLPDDILTKVDRAAMSVSLETRVPMLDQRIVELAYRMSTDLCFKDGRGKWPLRQLLSQYLPVELIDRPKMGFAVPLGSWLRGSLRDWAEELLSERCLKQGGFLHAAPVRRRWRDLLAGGDSHELALWGVLMFQSWRQRWAHAIRHG